MQDYRFSRVRPVLRIVRCECIVILLKVSDRYGTFAENFRRFVKHDLSEGVRRRVKNGRREKKRKKKER
ncbi:hypothetical protein ANTQUA_LOCUS2638 [Anthophora quadrimaculata]